MDSILCRTYIDAYKKDFTRIHSMEIYKWRAVAEFHKHWDPQHAQFHAMLDRALSKTDNLLQSGEYYPRRMLLRNTEVSPENVRAALTLLFDESTNLLNRVDVFRQELKALTKRNFPSLKDFQDHRAAIAYLTLRYPERYFFYKYKMFVRLCDQLHLPYSPRKGDPATITEFFTISQSIKEVVLADQELVQMHQRRLGQNDYKDKAGNLLTQDVIYAIAQHLNPNVVSKRQPRAITTDQFRKALSETHDFLTTGQRLGR